MNNKQKHYYIYNGNRFENMKDCCQGIGKGIAPRAFKHMLRMGIVEKIIIDNDALESTNISEHGKRKTAIQIQ